MSYPLSLNSFSGSATWNASSMAFQNLSAQSIPVQDFASVEQWNSSRVVLTPLEPRSDAWTLLLTAKASIEAVADPLLRPVMALGQQLGRISDALFAGIGPQRVGAEPLRPAADRIQVLDHSLDAGAKAARSRLSIQCGIIDTRSLPAVNLNLADCPRGMKRNIRQQIALGMKQDSYTANMILEVMEAIEAVVMDLPRKPGDIPIMATRGLVLFQDGRKPLVLLSGPFNGKYQQRNIVHEFWHVWENLHPELQKSGEYNIGNIEKCFDRVAEVLGKLRIQVVLDGSAKVDSSVLKQFAKFSPDPQNCKNVARYTQPFAVSGPHGSETVAEIELEQITDVEGFGECFVTPKAISRRGGPFLPLTKFEAEVFTVGLQLLIFPFVRNAVALYPADQWAKEWHARLQQHIPRRVQYELCPELGIQSDLSPGGAQASKNEFDKGAKPARARRRRSPKSEL